MFLQSKVKVNSVLSFLSHYTLVVCTEAFCICTVQTTKMKMSPQWGENSMRVSVNILETSLFPWVRNCQWDDDTFWHPDLGNSETLQLLPIPLCSAFPLLLSLRLQGLICITLMNEPQELQLSSQFVSKKSFCNRSSLHKATPSLSPYLTVSSSENPIALPSLRSNPTRCFTWIQE